MKKKYEFRSGAAPIIEIEVIHKASNRHEFLIGELSFNPDSIICTYEPITTAEMENELSFPEFKVDYDKSEGLEKGLEKVYDVMIQKINSPDSNYEYFYNDVDGDDLSIANSPA